MAVESPEAGPIALSGPHVPPIDARQPERVRANSLTPAPCAVPLVAGSTTSSFFPRIPRKRSLKMGVSSHAESVSSYPVQKIR